MTVQSLPEGMAEEATVCREHDALVDSSLHMDPSEFQCSICFELLLDPVVGSCGHDFCMHCISAWREERQRSSRSIQCPVCRAELLCSPLQSFGVCIRLRETVEKLFPEQLAARRRDVAQARVAASARAAAINASSAHGDMGTDAELQASFSTYADAYRQLAQSLLSLIARHHEAAVGQQYQQQQMQMQQMHSAFLRANLQGSVQLPLRPPAHPSSSTTSSSSTATGLQQQATVVQAAADEGPAAMQVDAAPTDAGAVRPTDAVGDAALHLQQPADPQTGIGAGLTTPQQQQQQLPSQGIAHQQAAALYQQQQELVAQWYASLLLQQQQQQQQQLVAVPGSSAPAPAPAEPSASMPRLLNSWMVPSALTSEADLIRLYSSLQNRIHTCERLLCMSGHADMVAARQSAEVQQASASLAAATLAASGHSGLPSYMLYLQQQQQLQATGQQQFQQQLQLQQHLQQQQQQQHALNLAGHPSMQLWSQPHDGVGVGGGTPVTAQFQQPTAAQGLQERSYALRQQQQQAHAIQQHNQVQAAQQQQQQHLWWLSAHPAASSSLHHAAGPGQLAAYDMLSAAAMAAQQQQQQQPPVRPVGGEGAGPSMSMGGALPPGMNGMMG